MIIRSATQYADDEPQPHATIRLARKRYVTKYGDRTGIKMWGYDYETKLWVVRRNSGRIEHYDKMVDFHTWTSVDLAELARAPFLNPYDAPRARGFREFLIHQASRSFSGFKTAESLLKRSKGLRHPITGKPLYHVMWPSTTKVRNFPIIQPYPEHSLNNMKFWMYDDTSASAVIMFPTDKIIMMDPKHL